MLFLSPAWNRRKNNPNPYMPVQEQLNRFEETNNTSTMHTGVMTGTYLSSRLLA